MVVEDTEITGYFTTFWWWVIILLKIIKSSVLKIYQTGANVSLNSKSTVKLWITSPSINNCSYYCDVCESLTEIDRNPARVDDSLASQLRGINCPQRPGLYTFRKVSGTKQIQYDDLKICSTFEISHLLNQEFCLNDWAAVDSDGDCEMDFLAGGKTDYKGAFSSLQQIGYVNLQSELIFIVVLC